MAVTVWRISGFEIHSNRNIVRSIWPNASANCARGFAALWWLSCRISVDDEIPPACTDRINCIQSFQCLRNNCQSAVSRNKEFVARPRARTIELPVLPVADARQQADPEHARERKARRRLPWRVRTHRVGWNAEPGLLQGFDHIDTFPHSRRHELPEHRDVVVRYVPVRHRAHLPVAERMPGQ